MCERFLEEPKVVLFPLVFLLGIKAKKPISVWKISNLWFCYLLFKMKLVSVCMCPINLIPPLSQPDPGQEDSLKWRKDVFWCDLSPFAV